MVSTAEPQRIEPLSGETFELFRKLIYDKTSINMRASKHVLVSNRLRKRILALRLGGYDEYYRYVTEGARGAEEMPHFVASVSTNETYFFREMSHFDALTARVIPELLARRRRLHIWSAGCSTGEEPYTMRMIIEQRLGAVASGAVRIVATDISRRVIAEAQKGEYCAHALRFVPPDVLDRYFEPAGGDAHRVREAVRASIDFRIHAMLKQPPPQGPFDVIFCRNVMIYFDKPTQRTLVDDCFASVLSPDGYLFIGHSESLTGTSERFRFVGGFEALSTGEWRSIDR